MLRRESANDPKLTFSVSGEAQRWSRFLRQAVKVDSTIQGMIHHEDAETLFSGVQGQGCA